MTTLFCDLVASTSLGEAADPEEVDAMLRRYGALTRQLVERYGGVVEKFIGDAVVAAFGVPLVHEDDPERAVRAGLKLVSAVEGLPPVAGRPVQVRVGVNTGEVLVRLNVSPDSGIGFLTGDAVNTAARIEAAAAPGEVAVGEMTHRLTERVITYRPLPVVVAKGKVKPVRMWRAVGALARTGLRTVGSSDTPFLGRDAHLGTLLSALGAAQTAHRGRACLLVGEPGIGKSRLVLELAHEIDNAADLITWRQGRCLAYGEGAGLAALSEMVMACLGIQDSDDVLIIEQKLQAALPEDDQRSWVRERLRPLLGLEATQAPPEESYAAWRSFLTHIAGPGPAVFVFEDLHWADEMLLGFLDDLLREPLDAQVLIIGTARPELATRWPGILTCEEGVERVSLAPLSRADSLRLVSALLDRRLSGDTREVVLDWVGGNPLFVEEYARLLLDHDTLEAKGVTSFGPGDDLLPPATVQAVLAARLDTLPPEQKAVLCDAAVLGEAFSTPQVVALSGRTSEQVSDAIAALVERDFLRPSDPHASSGMDECLFWHALLRDTAYAALTKRTRARKHRNAAIYFESQAKTGRELAEVLAHHYATALELATAVQDELAAQLVDPALRYLILAGERARRVDPGMAERHLTRALGLAPLASEERPGILARRAMALHDTARYEEAVPALEEAIGLLKAAGVKPLTAEALITLALTLETLGRPGSESRVAEAVALLDGEPPSCEMVRVLTDAALDEGNRGRQQHARELAERALAAAERLGFSTTGPDVIGADHYIQALMGRGLTRCDLGDVGGLEDVREASEAAVRQGSGPNAMRNYAVETAIIKGPAASIPIYRRCLELCTGRSFDAVELGARQGLFECLFEAGEWDAALAMSGELIATFEARDDTFDLVDTRTSLALLLCRRGSEQQALPLVEWAVEKGRQLTLPSLLCSALVSASAVYAILDPGTVPAVLEELRRSLDPSFAVYGVLRLPEMLRNAHRFGSSTLAGDLTDWIEPRVPTLACSREYGDALLAESQGDDEDAVVRFASVAELWSSFGVAYEEGQALLGRGRSLVELGRPGEAAEPLGQAREIFKGLRARPASEETAEWIARLAAS